MVWPTQKRGALHRDSGLRGRAVLGPHGPPNGDVFSDANFNFYNKHWQDFADVWNVKLFLTTCA